MNGTFLVLGEGAAVVAILFESFLVVSAPIRLFDFDRHIDVCRTNPRWTSLMLF